MKKLLPLTLLLLSACASPKAPRAVKRPQLSLSGVNLARTSLATVTASSVNGRRPLRNIFYGIRNAFDDGSNWHNGINYTYWLSSPADLQPRVDVLFLAPVTVNSLIVQNGPPFHAEITTQDGRMRATERIDEALHLPMPETGVVRVRLRFHKPEAGNVKVYEIQVLGSANRRQFGTGTPAIAPAAQRAFP